MFKSLTILTLAGVVASPDLMAETKSLSETMKVYVYPGEGQDEVQQSKDEADCYSWSVERTETDPFELAREANEQAEAANRAMAEAQSAGDGTTGKSAAGGAVAGALIGGIFGRGPNSGLRGAAVGATTGAIVGSSQENQAKAEATGQVAADAARAKEATQEQMDGFKKAFVACLEAKDYIAKF
jgi:hypothetical protein